MFSKGWKRKAFGQRIGHILRSCAFQQLDVATAHELTQMMHSSVDMPCRVRSRLAGFSLIIIQDALSSHISVAPTCRKLKPRSSARNQTASWPACGTDRRMSDPPCARSWVTCHPRPKNARIVALSVEPRPVGLCRVPSCRSQSLKRPPGE